MGNHNDKGAFADEISSVADNQSLLTREVWNLSVILLVLGVTVGNNTSNTVLHGVRQVLDGAMAESGSLGVATCQEDGVGTAGGGVVEVVAQLADAAEVGAAWEEVGGKAGWVVDALDGDVSGAEGTLEALTSWWADGGSLGYVLVV